MCSWSQRLTQTASHLKSREIIVVASSKENWEHSWAIRLEKWLETFVGQVDDDWPEYHLGPYPLRALAEIRRGREATNTHGTRVP